MYEKRPRFIEDQDNAPTLPHSSKTITKISKLLYELLQHLPYPPDLVPFDFYLMFLHLKNANNFHRTKAYFDSLPDSHFKGRVHKLEDH